MDQIIVTKYDNVSRFLIERKYAAPDALVVSNVGPDMAAGKHILGSVPLAIAARAAKYTEVKVTLPRGHQCGDLGWEEFLAAIKYVKTFKVEEIPDQA